MVDSGAFKKWLQAQTAQAVVGRARDPVGDPLANSLLVHLKRGVLVGRDRMRIGTSVVQLPAWARAYERLIDKRRSFARITAAEALQVLADARRRT